MTRSRLILLATLGSVALLGGAFIFQLLGYQPCKMCLWQRWPHAAAILIGGIALLTALPQRALAVLGALAAAITSGIGFYHAGVEQKWWDGPNSCTGGGSLDGIDLLSLDIAPVVMCDDIVWSLFGLSMAGWNAAFSLGLAALWLLAALRS